MAATIGGGRFNLSAPQALAELSGTILGAAVLAQVDRVGSWQIAQQEAGLARLHHFKADRQALFLGESSERGWHALTGVELFV